MKINWPWTKLDMPLALPSRSFSFNNDNEYCWEDWHEETKAKCPVRYWLQETVPTFFRRKWFKISNVWYWIRTHTYNRYHILDLRSNTSYQYRWGWIDSDSKMMLACFNLLKEYIEKEKPFEIIDWSDNPEIEKEIKDLYNWWMIGREHERKEYDTFWDKRDFKETTEEERDAHWKAEDELDKKDDEMLLRLIKIRNYLWT